MDSFYDGYLMRYPDPVGVVIRQPQRKFFYRGENQLYPTTMSSLGRVVHDVKSKQGKEVEKLIADVEKRMRHAAAELDFETAAQLRDKMIDLKKHLEDL